MFRTEINISPSSWKIPLGHRIFSLGSCFAVHIGELLSTYKFQTLTNPFGTIYNPLSIHKLISMSLDLKDPGDWAFVKNQGVYRNFLFHSEISSTNEEEFHSKTKKTLQLAHDHLIKTDVILLTFGTSIIYRLKENNELVANCHKMPSQDFHKSFLTADEIIESFRELYDRLKKLNNSIKFIITVSPVRHLKDTLELNSLSKAILRVACGKLVEEFEDVSYFPSYELVTDDLRDYRFYKEDMLHPNDQAIKYVWQKFVQVYFDATTLKFLSDWTEILKALQHKPFNSDSEEHKSFILKTIKKLDQFKNKTDISEELKILKAQLHE